MPLGLALLDRASKVCGSDSELARRLGVHRVFVSQMRTGKFKISPTTAAELANIAGEDARQCAIDAIIENAEGTRRAEVLKEILGKARAVGVVVMLLTSYGGSSKSDMEFETDVNNVINKIYIVEYLKAGLLRFATWAKAQTQGGRFIKSA